MQSLYELTPANAEIREAILELCQLDADFLKIELAAGILTMLTLPPTFAALVRIIVGQQLSTRVAKAIYFRLQDTVLLEPEPFLNVSEVQLQSMGLSRSKIITCRQLAEAISSGALDLQGLDEHSDHEIYKALTTIKGIGPWTAELFMLFALGRLDIFPAGDLAIQRGYAHLKSQAKILDPKSLVPAVEGIRPYRSVAAHLLWHYYRHITGFITPQ